VKSKKPNRNPGRVVGPYCLDSRRVGEAKPSYDGVGESLLENAPTDIQLAYQLLAHIGDQLVSSEPVAPALSYFLGHALKQPLELSTEAASDKDCIKALTDALHLTTVNRRPSCSFREVSHAIHQELTKPRDDNQEISLNQAVQIVAERYRIAKSTAHEYYNQCLKENEEQIEFLKKFNASHCNE
jgi:hypothetical protein